MLEPIVVFTMGYLSYILADMFEFSGIVRSVCHFYGVSISKPPTYVWSNELALRFSHLQVYMSLTSLSLAKLSCANLEDLR